MLACPAQPWPSRLQPQPYQSNHHSNRGIARAHLARVRSLEAFGRRPRGPRLAIVMGRHPKPFTIADRKMGIQNRLEEAENGHFSFKKLLERGSVQSGQRRIPIKSSRLSVISL